MDRCQHPQLTAHVHGFAGWFRPPGTAFTHRLPRDRRNRMAIRTVTIAGVGLADTRRKSRWPARLDWIQSVSGLFVALFMWGHMFFVSSILISKDAMWTITKFFEGYFFFGRPFPVIVSFVVAGVITLIVRPRVPGAAQVPDQLPAVLGLSRPHEDDAARGHDALGVAGVYRIRAVLPRGAALVRHADASGMIGPFESADRVWTGHYWPLYVLLLLAVELHGGIGLYRLAVKWGWFGGSDPNATRKRLKILKWVLTVFFLVLGFTTLAAYIKIGIDHAPNYGEPYVPASLAAPAKGGRNEGHLHGCSGHRRRARGAATGNRGQTARPRCDHPVARAAQAFAFKGSAGWDAGLARQRDQGPGRQRGHPFRRHRARQRLGRRPGGRAHVRQHRAQSGARARGVGRAVEPGAPRATARSSSTART